MSIHQISVAYQLEEDRIQVRVRTHQAELIEAWLTRRMMIRLWQPLRNAAAAVSLQTASKQSIAVPEAQDMMAQARREKSREGADFSSPFDESGATRLLGDQPFVVHAVDIGQPTDGQIMVRLRDAARREISLTLTEALLNNFVTLLENALSKSEWGLQSAPATTPPSDPAPTAPTTPKRLLN